MSKKSSRSGSLSDTIETVVIPALADNMIYMVVEDGEAVVVDPGDARPVLESLRIYGTRLSGVILTHSHGDHTAGAAELRRSTRCVIVGPSECSGVGLDQVINGGECISLGPMDFDVLATPGHTPGHVCYRMPRSGAVWTGDTLFVGGCGRIQKGSAASMWHSLCLLRYLPPETVVHTGHDYTMSNLEFAIETIPGDPAVLAMMARAQRLIKSGRPASSSTIATECESNIFLRADTQAVRTALAMPDASAVDIFAELRRMKDEW